MLWKGREKLPYISEDIFNDQMRGLMVARGRYESEKKKDEIKRYWYLEFRDCDERAFIRVMGELKFAGDGGFPSFADFRVRYNIIMPPSLRDEGREYCGKCNEGRVFYRDVHKESEEVYDYVANCRTCTRKLISDHIYINPHKLHKDKLGRLRTFEALVVDRIPQEIKWPPFLKEQLRKFNKNIEVQYFIGLHPEDDPEVEMKFIKPAPELVKVPY